jgi:streptogramin lyase
VLDILESRRLLSGGGSNPQGVATGAGMDASIWFTLGSNSIGMIDPGHPTAGVTQYAIPTPNSGPGPIAAGPQPILYASDAATNQIYKVDKTIGSLLQTIAVGRAQDSLIFDGHNEIIYTLGYSVPGAGQVRRVDPTVGLSSDTLLATIGKNPGDLALVPGGHFVLALGRADGKIYKVDLDHPGQTPTIFGSGQYSGGIVYDSSGRLFAVTKTGVVELDPNTFAVMASSATMSQLDGLAFDPFTGNLFASSHAVAGVSGQQGVYELSLQPGHFLQSTLITSSSLPPNFLPDGLEPDGEGNLYVASFQDKIYRIDLTTGKMTALTSSLTGLDDLVPLAGSSGHSVPDTGSSRRRPTGSAPSTRPPATSPRSLSTPPTRRSMGSPPGRAGRSGSLSSTRTGSG